MPFHRLDVENQKIGSFSEFETLSGLNFIFVDAKYNKLLNFKHFGRHPSLVELDLRYNRIESFFGLTCQESLRIIHLVGNPVAEHPLYRIMVLLTIGYTVKVIDNRLVSPSEVSFARSLGAQAALAVSCGWMLDAVPRSSAEYKMIASFFFQKHQEYLSQKKSDTTTLSEVVKRLSPDLIPFEYQERNRICFPESRQQGGNYFLCRYERKEGGVSSEVVCASCVEFDAGITVHTNLVPHKSFVSVLRFCGSLFIVLDFASRKIIVSLDSRTIALTSSSEMTLTFQSISGVVVQAEFQSTKVLEACRATLLLRQHSDYLDGVQIVSSSVNCKDQHSTAENICLADATEASKRKNAILREKKRLRALKLSSGKEISSNAALKKVASSASLSTNSEGEEAFSFSENSSISFVALNPSGCKVLPSNAEPSGSHTPSAVRSEKESPLSSATVSKNIIGNKVRCAPLKKQALDFSVETKCKSDIRASSISSVEQLVRRSRSDGGVRTPLPFSESTQKSKGVAKLEQFLLDSDADSESG